MRYATLNGDGAPSGFYSDDIHSDIPKEAIEITEEQWLECINNQGQRAFVNGVLVEYVYIPTDSESTARKVAEAKQYLASTDYKMTMDYDQDVTDIKVKRQEAREVIRLSV